ncbi:TauD/TfdA family dioxygenase [Plantactinospora endophytica]|uniref:L-asparagine oxygenase n=1 Tax=Plantactinospora endophytica TaxID=673535 RepID=A0ABQ4DW28_9ACTN|nr:TauD/TfdA family dioxygenase [Plantactinospora endophytica]GIG86266.1 L-asparagine oxygenase [Plantactinospora endophytica]
MPAQLTAEQTIRLTPDETKALWEAATDLTRSEDVAALDADGITELACGLTAAVPPRLLRALHRHRSGAGLDALLVAGLLPADQEWGPTPRGSAEPLTGPAQAAALCLLNAALQLGEPFTFSTFYSGRLVQHVVPVPTMEHTQTSESSSGMLDWHVEDGFSPDRCDHFALLCVRGETAAHTRFTSARDLELPDEVREVLRRPTFLMAPDTAHEMSDRRPVATAVLWGPPEAPEICYDAHYLTPAEQQGGHEAEALRLLGRELDVKRVEHALAPGELLLLDNRRTVHARTPFSARGDGTDRWLLRTMICSSLPRFRDHRTRIWSSPHGVPASNGRYAASGAPAREASALEASTREGGTR